MPVESPPVIHFETLGCRLNQDESEGAAFAFKKNGFKIDMEPLCAQRAVSTETILAIINTCTVTAKAEQKARRIIHLMLQKFPSALIIVTGCYAQLDASILQKIDDRVLVLPGSQKHKLADIAKEMNDGTLSVSQNRFSKEGMEHFIFTAHNGQDLLNAKSVLKPRLYAQDSFSLFTPVFQKHSRPLLKIQDGCNNACTFCRIHLARGTSVSLSPEEVIHRVQTLEDAGMNEVVLTGVNLSQYSAYDANKKHYSLATLLDEILLSTKHIRVRLSSLYPQSINDDLCKSLSSYRVQPFFHLSIQSASDAILAKMARPHSVSHVKNAIKKLREVKNNPFISCDIIAGFPGESEEDFSLTADLCKEARFSWIHVFPFSARPGTKAKDFPFQIPEAIKKERVKILTNIAMQGKIAYSNQWHGKTLFAITENSNSKKKSAQKLYAVTENFLHVECPLPDDSSIPFGSAVRVTIDATLEKAIFAGEETECIGHIA